MKAPTGPEISNGYYDPAGISVSYGNVAGGEDGVSRNGTLEWGDGIVGFEDLIALLAAWGNEGGPEDLDGDGFVGFGDLLIVPGLWGPSA